MSEVRPGYPRYGPWLSGPRSLAKNRSFQVGGGSRQFQAARDPSKKSWTYIMNEKRKEETWVSANRERTCSNWRQSHTIPVSRSSNVGSREGSKEVGSQTQGTIQENISTRTMLPREESHKTMLFDLNEDPHNDDKLSPLPVISISHNLPSPPSRGTCDDVKHLPNRKPNFIQDGGGRMLGHQLGASNQ